jgi:hypothetical protein
MNENNTEKSEINSGLNVDNEALKNLAENLLKNEKSLGPIMQMATNFLGSESLLSSIKEQVLANKLSMNNEKQENTFPSVIQNQENFTKDILMELKALSQKLDNFTNLTLELRSLSQRLNTITNDISSIRKELQYLGKQNDRLSRKRKN